MQSSGISTAKKVREHAPPAALKRVLSSWQLYVLLLPAVIYLGIFNYGPMYGLQIAFKEFRPSLGIWGSQWTGLKNFIRFVTFPDFWKMIRNTLAITVYQLATFPCAVILAILFNEMHSLKFKKVVQMVTYAPHFLSTVVLCSLVLLILAPEGPINNALVSMGLNQVEFMFRPKYFPGIYVWSGVWQSIGWSSIIYLAALSGVSPELIEAARIDGAGRMQVIWHVNIPAILPTIIITFILNTGGMLNVGFEKIFLLQNPLNLDASRVISTYVYEMGIGGAQFSYAAAIGLFNNLVNIILLLAVNTISRKVSEIGLW
ncbi:MAG: ABC transporter permease subunit [Treponema sp.]|nr:ABC transporter permease subunit [Treponema sp.]